MSVVEYSILMVIAILAFIPMKAYLKRSVQGRVRGQVDQFAPQFSYEYGNVTTRTVLTSSSTGALAGGINQENATQALSRTTDEAIEGSSAETTRIGLQ